MNRSRYEALLRGLTAVARKVFDAVPSTEPMPTKLIYGELMRLGTPVANYRILEGCLASLVDSGLVHESRIGEFVRVTAPAPIPPKPLTQMAVAMSNAGLVPPAPISASRPQTLTQRFDAMVAKMDLMRKELEDLALDVIHELESNQRDAEKFRAAQALFSTKE